MNTPTIIVRFEYKNQKTKASLIKKEDKSIIAERTVKVREGDKFDKRTGRLSAFKKVMKVVIEQNILGREERTTLWLAFRTTVKQPVKK